MPTVVSFNWELKLSSPPSCPIQQFTSIVTFLRYGRFSPVCGWGETSEFGACTTTIAIMIYTHRGFNLTNCSLHLFRHTYENFTDNNESHKLFLELLKKCVDWPAQRGRRQLQYINWSEIWVHLAVIKGASVCIYQQLRMIYKRVLGFYL